MKDYNAPRHATPPRSAVVSFPVAGRDVSDNDTMRLTLFWKLLGAVALTLLLVVLWLGMATYQAQQQHRVTAAARQAAELCRMLVATLSSTTEASELAARFAGWSPGGGTEARCYDREGRLVAATDAAAAATHFYPGEIQRLVQGAESITYVDQDATSGRGAHHGLPVPSGGQLVWLVDVRVAVERGAISSRWLGLAALAGLLGVAACGWALARQLQPLVTLVAGATALARGDNASIPSTDRRDEFGELASALREFQQIRQSRTIEYEDKTGALEAVLENMLEGVLAVSHDERVLLANEASGRMLGFVAATALGKPLVEIARSRPLQAILRKTAADQQPHRDEFDSPGEPRRVLSVRSAPLSQRAASGVMIVIHDVTELRRLENLRKEFVANVSHELKTPLASIKAYAETLRLGALEDPEFRLGFVERIEEQAERLHALISDLLLLARVEAGREVFDFVELALTPLVQECLSDFEPIAESKQVRLTCNAESPALQVYVDEEGLRTILNNLVDNALKYTPAHGRVCISWRGEEGYAILEVEDTGIGISARDQQRIFERFYRADKARSRELGGTGLGLAIVKHLALALGGDVSLTSQEGAGSTFRVRLPLARSLHTHREAEFA